MRILAISYLFPNCMYPNYGIFVFNRLKALLPYCDIKVINPVPWFPFHHRLKRYRNYNLIPEKEIMDGLEVFHPRFFMIPRFFKVLDAFTFALAAIPLALRLRKTFPYDLIDIHWTYPDLPSGCLLARLLKKKMLVTVRGKEAFYSSEGGFRKIIVEGLLKAGDAVIALSNDLKTLCVSKGVPRGKLRVIPNGVDIERFHFIPRDKCRKRLKLALSDRIFLSVGSLTQGKGFDRLIKIFPSILRNYPESRLYIIGSNGPAGNNGKKLLRLTKSLRLEEHVRFMGEVPNHNLVFWYNAADYFCLASRSEGSPNVLNEALGCGCPAVATDVGAASEILNQEAMGALVPNSEDAIFSGLQTVMSGQFDRREIATHMKQCDWDGCARKVLEVYLCLQGPVYRGQQPLRKK